MPRTRKNLYRVFAGKQNACFPVYETTKREKAERYLHHVVMRNKEYTKAYIECVYGHSDDKRSRWKEVD